MAKRFLTPINLVNLTSDPATGSEGDLYFNTTDNVVKIYVDGVWTELQGGAGGGASVIYTAEQPDITGLPTGTIWVDSDAEVGTSTGGGGGTGLSYWSENENGDLIPDTANLQNIGSSNYPIQHLYVSGSSILFKSPAGVIGLSLDENNNLQIDEQQIITENTINTYVDSGSIINTASAAAYASASAYTDSQLAVIDLSSAIQTASAAAVSYLVDGAPEALNTLNELSAAIDDNANILETLLTKNEASASYLPLSSSASFYRWTKTYSASASVISGVDDNSITLDYNEGYIQLFINGVMLDPSEYTATSGSSITVVAPVLSGEVVDIFAFRNSTSVNTYSQAQIDAKYNNYTRWRKTLSASATIINGVDDNNLQLSYNPGYEQLYLNGILLTRIIDYAVTDFQNITLSQAAVSGDIIEIINTQPFNVADVYTTSQSDNRYLTQSSASSTYLTQSSASSTYYTQTQIDTLEKGPAFFVYRTTSQSITANTVTKIQFNAELFDTNNCFDSTTNYRFTPNVAGYYQFNGIVLLFGNSGSNASILFFKNGIEYGTSSNAIGSDTARRVSGSTIAYMNGTTDYMELYGYVAAGTTSVGGTSTGESTQFSGCMIRRA